VSDKQLLRLWKSLAGDTSTEPWDRDRVFGFFECFRPTGAGAGVARSGDRAPPMQPRRGRDGRSGAAGFGDHRRRWIPGAAGSGRAHGGHGRADQRHLSESEGIVRPASGPDVQAVTGNST